MAQPPHLNVGYFHAHVYFEPAVAAIAEKFQQRIKAEWASRDVAVTGLLHKAAGPHPLPMFEAGFSRDLFTDFVTWLQFERPEELPILIHPFTDEIVPDHTTRPLWLGQQPPGPYGGINKAFLESLGSKEEADKAREQVLG